LSPIFVAIDTPEMGRALTLATILAGTVGGIKLGLEFFAANGPAGVAEIGKLGLPIFLDLKLHDIPNTVAGAMRSFAALGPAIVTVHAAGGRAMLEAARAAAPQATRVVAVTVLTSLDSDDLGAIGVGGGAAAQVDRFAALAREAGCDGIVCSGEEVEAARRAWPGGLLVVPGVRPEIAGAADQKRVVTPRAAMDRGASVLVIGRPITLADDPAAAARAISATL
jgi:orotidine-5'-phosphate decarboxylase